MQAYFYEQNNTILLFLTAVQIASSFQAQTIQL
jgi:hypothetical protein